MPTEGEVLIQAIEAAYDLRSSDEAWLQTLARTVAPRIDRGLGVIASYFSTTAQGQCRIESTVAGSESVPAKLLGTFRRVVSVSSPDFLRRTMLGPELVSSVGDEFARPLRRGERLPSTVEGIVALGIPADPFKVFIRETGGAMDTLALNALQPDACGFAICALSPTLAVVPTPFRRRWSRVVLHFINAHRLRRALRGSRRELAPEAVLSPQGRLEDATFDPSRAHRDLLRQAVERRERARGPLRRENPDEALLLWQGLVQGRWSLVDQVDHDGKRFVLARRNEPGGAPLQGLSPREQQVVAMALQGRSNKLIAYSMGLNGSTVATHLARGAGKLDRPTRARLSRRRAGR